MPDFALFTLLNEPNVLWVIVGVCFLAIAMSCVGTFAWLNRQSLIGDAMAHCALPGIAAAFLFSQSRHPLILLPVAIFSSLLGNMLMNWLIQRSKLTADSALAIVLSGFFAFGALLLSVIQKLPIAGKSGIDQMLFGQAAAVDDTDAIILIIITSLVLLVITVIMSRLRMIIFDTNYSQSIGINVSLYKQIMGVLIAICVVTGIQIVGVILVSALLIFPAINARQWSHHLRSLLFIAIISALIASVSGVLVSYHYSHMPTGPWVVVFLALILITSLLFSPHGFLIKRIKIHQRQIIIHAENVIRVIYLLNKTNKEAKFTLHDIININSMPLKMIKKGLTYAIRQNWVTDDTHSGYRLTQLGTAKAQIITRHHRLWEQYLSQNKQFSTQNLHLSAEYAEHIIDDELADSLDEFLGHPSKDPHGQSIPSKL